MTTDLLRREAWAYTRPCPGCGPQHAGAPAGYLIHPDKAQPLLYVVHSDCHGSGVVRPWVQPCPANAEAREKGFAFAAHYPGKTFSSLCTCRATGWVVGIQREGGKVEQPHPEEDNV